MATELRHMLGACRGPLGAVAALSGATNVLALTGSFFMLAVYDRVIPSGSVPSLVALGLLAAVLFGLQAVVDVFRGRLLTRTGLMIREALAGRVYDVVVRNAAAGARRAGGAVRDLDQVQGFLASLGPTALFDLPWLPVYLFLCFSFHPYVGVAVLCGAAMMVALTIISNMLSGRLTRLVSERTAERSALLAATGAQAETIEALGMTLAFAGRFKQIEDGILEESRRLADATALLTTVSRTFRTALQSLVLAVGAWLVINHDATAGVMTASSILAARALAPIELATAHWKGFVSFRQAWARLETLLAGTPATAVRFALPAPARALAVERLAVAVPGESRPVVQDVSFALEAGSALGIIGPTGSGKSVLLRALVGLWAPAAGAVRLDGQALGQWPATERGRFIGYVPQSVALFEGTIAENIARFDPRASAAAVIEAAAAAGVHELIARLPDGYDTRVGDAGAGLSGGQAQRVGLARALYGAPFLLALDEPNANLDADGEAALQRAIQSVRDRGGIVLLVAHRPSSLAAVDFVLLMREGRMQRFGPAGEVIEALVPRPARPRITAA